MFISTVCLIGPSWLKKPSTFLIYISLSIFFSLNPCFLANSELITSPVALLSNNTSTVIPSCVFILSSPIFTVMSLNVSSPFAFLILAFFLVPSESDVPTSIFVNI